MTLYIIGALINAVAILLGGGIGLILRGRIPQKFSDSIIRAIGLSVCVIGVAGAVKGDLMLLVVSLLLGTVIGELLHIEDGLQKLGGWIQKFFAGNNDSSTFAEGFVVSTILFCVGAMAIIGSIESGLNNDQTTISAKSVLDGVCAMALASKLGIGVLFSAGMVLLYQGSIELFAGYLQNVITDALITQISAAGSVMILGIGLNMTANATIKIANLLPGLIVAVGYYYIVLV